MMPCPCTTCLNHIEHRVEEVQFYLFKYGIDLRYTKWDKHGEKDEQATTAQIPVNATTEFVDDMDFDMDFGSEIPTDGPETVEMVNAIKESFDEDDFAKFQELLLDAEKPLYKGCTDFTKLSAIVKLLNLKDSQAWRTIDEKILEIAKDPRNLRLGISADGVDFNSGTRHHSVWLLLSVIYNLPLWLCMKRKFIMLSIGVDTYDASTKENFNLCAVVLWTINDYPALGTLCGCPYSGFKGCVVCGKDTHRLAPNPLTGEQIYNEVQHIENKWGKGKRTNNKTSENQEDTRGRGGKIQKQKRKTTEEEGSSNQVNEAYWKKFNIWYRKLRYWRHNSVPHCIDFMHVEKNVCESLVRTLLNVPGKTKDGMNARLDLAELGIKLALFARQEEDKTTLPPACYTLTNAEKDIFCEMLSNIRVIKGHVRNRNRPEGCIAEETIVEEIIEFFSEYHITMKTIGIPPDKHVTNENEDGKPLSADKSSEVSGEVFQKAHLYVIQNTDEIVPYIERHKQVLKTKNPGKRIALLENEHSKSFAKWLREEVERELAISKDSVSEL
ncbi:hypothetical protein Tco_0895652 [Tanacetum coccineum]|uniref:Transposase-associated domain-containing protein n=1 Tax=Tanacetum coccineum TaxID=301880 RepID=A0ABQ5CFK7_9ASTR